MHGARVFAFLIAIAFMGASFSPCPAPPSTPVQSVQESAVENGQGSFPPRSTEVVNGGGARTSAPLLYARCPCGCDERPAVAGSSPGLGIALISRAPSLVAVPGDRELERAIPFLPLPPSFRIDTVPRPS